MASIEKRRDQNGKMRYRVKIRRKGHPSISRSFARLTDARTFARTTEVDIEAGRALPAQESRKHTLRQAIVRYKDTHLPGKAPKTRRQQSQQLDWWCEQIGHLRLADVSPALLAEHRDKLSHRYAVSTVLSYLAAIGAVLTACAREWQWIDSSPMARIKRPTGTVARTRFLSDDERQRLLAVCRESSHPYLYTIVIIALSTGARKDEILSLRWNDVDLRQGYITLRLTKNKDTRRIALAGPALALMRERHKVRQLQDDRVFPSSRIDARVVKIDKVWREALKAADIQDFVFHDLRHSAASYLLMTGATLEEVREILGQRSLTVAKRYAHMAEGHVDGVVKRMNEKIFAQG